MVGAGEVTRTMHRVRRVLRGRLARPHAHALAHPLRLLEAADLSPYLRREPREEVLPLA